MKGFKLLEVTCKNLEHKLADSKEKLQSREQAYVALEEKAWSDEASYTKLILKLEDQIRSREIAYTELASQAQEKVRIDGVAHAAGVSRVEARLQTTESAYSELSERLEQCESALRDRESVTLVP